jgi:filamentous hemagglutinin family protein
MQRQRLDTHTPAPMPAHVSSLPVALALACGLGACATPAWAAGPAGVKLDGTLGGSAAVLSGPVYNITQSLGQLAGGNLFFSFQYFNIATNQTARFTTTSAGINNVISRVTGGYASSIDGEIALSAASGAPNFYFINPAGVTFTANAFVNVPAAFAVTTANYLKFSDGNFYADPSKTSTLSQLAPEAFGFLGTTRAPVDLEGAVLLGGDVGRGEIQVIAGDVTIDGGGQLAALENATGDLRVIATGSRAVEVPQSGSFTSTDGSVTLQAGGEIVSSPSPSSAAGAITVSAGTLEIDGTHSVNYPSEIISVAGSGAGAIRVDVGGSAMLNNGGAILAGTANGVGASITLNAGALTIEGANGFSDSRLVTLSVGAGSAGAINVNAAGAVNILNGGTIAAETLAGGNVGTIAVTAQSLNIDGGTSPNLTGILRQADDSGASTGQLSVTTSGPITMANDGLISSDTFSPGNAGNVNVVAQSLNLASFASISSSAGEAAGSPGLSTGNAGEVSVTTSGATTLTSGGSITANSFTTGNAGNVIVNAASLSIEGSPKIASTGIFASAFGVAGNAGNVTVSAGSLDISNGLIETAVTGTGGTGGRIAVTVSGSATIGSGGYISTDSFSAANAGNIAITAGSLDVDAGNSSATTGIASSGYGSGNAGQVAVTSSGATTVANGAQIASSAFGAGNAGSVTLNVGSLDVDGGAGTSQNITGIFSSTNELYSGGGGQIAVTSGGTVNILNGAELSTTTSSAGSAGNVTVNAAALRLDGGSSPLFTGIASSNQPGSSGNAGDVSVTTSGAATVASGAEISSATFGAGHAGDVILNVGGLSVTGSAATGVTGILSSTEPGATGDGGRVTVTSAGDVTLSSGGSIESQTFGKGYAGEVSVTSAATVSLASGGQINSNTYATGNAGDVTLAAASLKVDGSGSNTLTGVSTSDEQSSGNAGQVSVTTSGAVTITNGAQILSATFAAGNAGAVTLKAGSLTVEDGSPSDISALATSAAPGSSGAAGRVTVDVSGTATVTDYGFISSAAHGSGGQPGTVAISAGTLVVGEHGLISIENGSTVANPNQITPTRIDLHTGSLQMDGGQITAASTGNIAASAIDIDYQQTMHLDPSSITTTSNQGNGGPITITGQGLLWLQNSSITTSVLGSTNGNGGDIRISVPYIVLDSGVIQANTTAPQASGGNVVISAEALIPSFESYVLGGTIVSFNSASLGQNVVQAAAPDGVSGTLNVTVPSLDLGNALLGLTGTPSTPIALSRSRCTYRRGSSLSIAGRGGLPVSYRDPLWIDGETQPEPATPAAPATHGSLANPPVQGLSRIACR